MTNLPTLPTAPQMFNRALNGSLPAQIRVAECYEHGTGCATRSVILAVLWYSIAAGNGDAGAQFRVGEMYASGLPGLVKIDKAQAREWFESAIKLGHDDAHGALEELIKQPDNQEVGGNHCPFNPPFCRLRA